MASKIIKYLFAAFTLILIPYLAFAEGNISAPSIGGIRIEFFLFGLTLIGVALFHHKTFWVALIGLTVIILYKLIFISGFPFGEHFLGSNSLVDQFLHKEMREGEWGILLNLLGLLLGFAVLAKIFEESGIPRLKESL